MLTLQALFVKWLSTLNGSPSNCLINYDIQYSGGCLISCYFSHKTLKEYVML